MYMPKDYIVWDLETTGLDPKTDKILEIGVMRFMDGLLMEQESWILNHQIQVPAHITEITGITQEMCDKGHHDIAGIMSMFANFFDNVEANITHNGYKFDIPFLFNAVQPLVQENIFETFKEKVQRGCVDTAVMYKAREMHFEQRWNENFLAFSKRVMDMKVFGLKYNVAHCCNDLGIDTSKATFHRALGDVYLTNEIYKKLRDEIRTTGGI